MANIYILKAEIKSILAIKSKEGATFKDIKDEYAQLIGKELCFNSSAEFTNFMATIPEVCAVKGSDGRLAWHTNSLKSKHIAAMVQNQKPPREVQRTLKNRVFYNSTNTCYYNDNYLYKNQRKCKSDSYLNEIKRSNKNLFYKYELIGDDFFLNIAHFDCKHKLEYVPARNGFKGRPIKKCGHCVSGQTIKDVTNMLHTNVKLSNRVILNVGSVDLLHGRAFIEMREDFLQLYSEFKNRGIQPIVTTLAPLANMCFSKEIRNRWQQFNLFLHNTFEDVLDIACCFLNNSQRVIFERYEPLPKYVSGSNQAHLLWNHVGRQRVIKYLKDGLAEIAYRKSIFTKNIF